MPRPPLQTLESVRKELLVLRKRLGSWQAVALEKGISIGTAVRVSRGYDPKSPAIRLALVLPALALGRVCLVHNKVHDRQCRAATPASTRGQAVRRIADMSARELGWRLRNREEL